MHLIFWLYKSKSNKKGLAPIYLRITLGNEKTEVSTGVSISPNGWNSRKALVKGSSERAKELNKKLQQLKDNVLSVYNDLVAADLPLSVEVIKSALFRNNDQRISLLYAISYHNDLFKKNIGIEKCRATYTKFDSLKSKLIMFMQLEYKRSDLFLKELSHQFMVNFESHLKVENRIAHDTAMKYIQQLKRLYTSLLRMGGWSRTPFMISSVPFHQLIEAIWLLKNLKHCVTNILK
jgi:hypothetical protein